MINKQRCSKDSKESKDKTDKQDDKVAIKHKNSDSTCEKCMIGYICNIANRSISEQQVSI